MKSCLRASAFIMSTLECTRRSSSANKSDLPWSKYIWASPSAPLSPSSIFLKGVLVDRLYNLAKSGAAQSVWRQSNNLKTHLNSEINESIWSCSKRPTSNIETACFFNPTERLPIIKRAARPASYIKALYSWDKAIKMMPSYCLHLLLVRL